MQSDEAKLNKLAALVCYSRLFTRLTQCQLSKVLEALRYTMKSERVFTTQTGDEAGELVMDIHASALTTKKHYWATMSLQHLPTGQPHRPE